MARWRLRGRRIPYTREPEHWRKTLLLPLLRYLISGNQVPLFLPSIGSAPIYVVVNFLRKSDPIFLAIIVSPSEARRSLSCSYIDMACSAIIVYHVLLLTLWNPCRYGLLSRGDRNSESLVPMTNNGTDFEQATACLPMPPPHQNAAIARSIAT